MQIRVRGAAVLVAILALGNCNDATGPTEQAFQLDFEDRPDDEFVAVSPPVTLASGITVSEILPAGSFYDFTTADGWGVGCGATASSGIFMIGIFNDGDLVSGTITFAPPVSRVQLVGGTTAGDDFVVTAYDAEDEIVGADTTTSACPTLDANDSLSIDAGGSNRIARIEISGGVAPVIDDLTYYRFQ